MCASKTPFDLRQQYDYNRGFADPYYADTLRNWLHSSQNFEVKPVEVVNNSVNLYAEKKGIHVNFRPELQINFVVRPNGCVSAFVHYTAQLLPARAGVVGFLTGGLSLAVGVGTGAAHVIEAEDFLRSVVAQIDTLAVEKGVQMIQGAPVPQQHQHQHGHGKQQQQQQPPPSYQGPIGGAAPPSTAPPGASPPQNAAPPSSGPPQHHDHGSSTAPTVESQKNSLFHVREARQYPGFHSPTFDKQIAHWLEHNGFNIVEHVIEQRHKRIKGSGKGIHVNFRPEVTVTFDVTSDNAWNVRIDYVAVPKVVSGVIVGVLTGGLSAGVGAATLAKHTVEAEGYVGNLLGVIESEATGPGVVRADDHHHHHHHDHSSTKSAAIGGAAPPSVQSKAPPSHPPIGTSPPSTPPANMAPPSTSTAPPSTSTAPTAESQKSSMFHVREARQYPGFHSPTFDKQVAHWLEHNGFRVTECHNGNVAHRSLKGEAKGIHVNFQAEVGITFDLTSDNKWNVRVDYVAVPKVVSGVIVGVLTGGLSAGVGAATLAKHKLEAEGYVATLLGVIESEATGPGVIRAEEHHPGHHNQHHNAAPAPASHGAPPSNPPYVPPAASYAPPTDQFSKAPPPTTAPVVAPAAVVAPVPTATPSPAASPQRSDDPKVNGLRVIKELAAAGLITAEDRKALTKKIFAKDEDTFAMIEALQDDPQDLAENLKMLI